MIIAPYSQVRHLIREGDVLLFRYKNGMVSWFITKAGEGVYVHVGLASWSDATLEIVEFREGNPLTLLFGGSGSGEGHAVNLSYQVKKHNLCIDVYRPAKYTIKYSYDNVNNIINEQKIVFNGRSVTHNLRNMTGQPYGWKVIWNMLKYNMFGLRLLYNTSKKILDDNYINQNFPVCSTSVAKVFRENYVDLVPNKSDVATEPSDIGRSPVLSYLFTLEKD